jgi:Mlc titration factor MtfA (ptsG expression regulator)
MPDVDESRGHVDQQRTMRVEKCGVSQEADIMLSWINTSRVVNQLGHDVRTRRVKHKVETELSEMEGKGDARRGFYTWQATMHNAVRGQ